MKSTEIERQVKKEKIKLSVQYTIITLIIVVALMVSFYLIYSKNTYNNFDASISQRAISIASTLAGEEELNIEDLNSLNLSNSPFQASNEFLEITDGKGKVLYSLGSISPISIEIRNNSFSYGTYEEDVNNKKMVLKMRAFTTEIKNSSYYVTVARSYDDIKDTLENIIFSFSIIIPFVILVIGLFSYRIASIAIYPIEESFRKFKQFTEDASHELKTPLAAIKTNIDVSLSKESKEIDYYKKKLAVIGNSVNMMANVINRMLYLSKLDSNATDFKKEKINISELLKEVKERFADAALKKNVEVEVMEENIELETNKEALDEILSIIVENAINFNKPEGRVKIAVNSSSKDVKISVTDTGIGVSKEDLPHIFDRFYRGEKSRSRETGGAGLGLSITKRLVEYLGGEIDVESKESVGSTFTIIIPKRE